MSKEKDIIEKPITFLDVTIYTRTYCFSFADKLDFMNYGEHLVFYTFLCGLFLGHVCGWGSVYKFLVEVKTDFFICVGLFGVCGIGCFVTMYLYLKKIKKAWQDAEIIKEEKVE